MPDSEQAIQALANQTREEATRLVVTTDETFQAAGEMLKEIKKRRARISEFMDPIIQAAHKTHKTALDQKKTLEKPYIEADKHLRAQVSGYKALQDAARNREALALASRGEMTLPREAATVDGLGFTKKWAFEVIDPDALPKEFTIPDEPKIRRTVEALGEAHNIPGIRVWQYDQPNVRG